MSRLLDIALDANEKGMFAAWISSHLTKQMIHAVSTKETMEVFTDLAITIRENIRNSGRDDPNAVEAEALLLISRAAQRIASDAVKAPYMCLLSKHESDNYESMIAAEGF